LTPNTSTGDYLCQAGVQAGCDYCSLATNVLILALHLSQAVVLLLGPQVFLCVHTRLCLPGYGVNQLWHLQVEQSDHADLPNAQLILPLPLQVEPQGEHCQAEGCRAQGA